MLMWVLFLFKVPDHIRSQHVLELKMTFSCCIDRMLTVCQFVYRCVFNFIPQVPRTAATSRGTSWPTTRSTSHRKTRLSWRGASCAASDASWTTRLGFWYNSISIDK